MKFRNTDISEFYDPNTGLMKGNTLEDTSQEEVQRMLSSTTSRFSRRTKAVIK